MKECLRQQEHDCKNEPEDGCKCAMCECEKCRRTNTNKRIEKQVTYNELAYYKYGVTRPHRPAFNYYRQQGILEILFQGLCWGMGWLLIFYIIASKLEK